MGPQDIKLAPDGSVFYIADQRPGRGLGARRRGDQGAARDPHRATARTGSTSPGTPRRLYVTNRHAGTVRVLDAYTGAVTATWPIPGGGSPDMGNVTADGSQLWLSGRWDRAVYVLSTVDGTPDQEDRRRERAARAVRVAAARAGTRSGTPASPGDVAGGPPHRPAVPDRAAGQGGGRGGRADRRAGAAHGAGRRAGVAGQRRSSPATCSARRTARWPGTSRPAPPSSCPGAGRSPWSTWRCTAW